MYTKRKWEVRNGDVHEVGNCARHSCVAVISKTAFWPEAEANARLIAASPVMYEFIISLAHNGNLQAKILLETLDLLPPV